jgi:hypothetical protein
VSERRAEGCACDVKSVASVVPAACEGMEVFAHLAEIENKIRVQELMAFIVDGFVGRNEKAEYYELDLIWETEETLGRLSFASWELQGFGDRL